MRAQNSDPAQSAVGAGDGAPDTEVEDKPSSSRGPSRAGSRLALRNWRITTRLISLIALPVVAATALGGLRIQSSMDDMEQLDTMQLLTDMTQQATLLAAALQDERDRSAGPLISGRSPKSDEVVGPRDRTDDARQAFSDATLAIDDENAVMQGVHSTVLDIGRQLNQIKDIREEAYEDPEYASQTITRYNDLIDALLSLSQDMAQATSNSEMIRSTRALAAFSSAKEHASIQRAVITAGLAKDEIDGDSVGLSTSDWRFGKTHHEAERARLRSFTQIYGDDQRAEAHLEPLEGGIVNIVTGDRYAETVFTTEGSIIDQSRTYRDWYDLSRTKIDAMDTIEQNLLAEMEEQASVLKNEARQDAIINGAIIVLVLGVSLVGAFVVARSMVRSLRRLQHTAQEVARTRLPEVVRQMSEAEPQDVNISVESVGMHTRDEIGQVAQAFDDVHREAVRLAGEQALLRGNVNAMFTNLSRRSQGLIQRQLSLISELESREADPDQLSSLFKLDHLATRMRRNGENLLVLAGEEPGRRWTRPVPLVDVLRAAASEVEQYERVELSAVPRTEVAGRVVNDLVHLLAELLENATSFSSPQTKVKVTGHALPDGRVLVEIHDTGIGLSPEDLADINHRLAEPPTVDVAVSRRMGLFVVGRLSLRHGIRIQLRPSDSGGTTALVMLPAAVAQGNRGTPGGQTGSRPGPSGSGAPASATLHREPAAAGRHAGGSGTQEGSARGISEGPDRSQVPGAHARPALPSRPGSAEPGSAGAGFSAPGAPGPGAQSPPPSPDHTREPSAESPAAAAPGIPGRSDSGQRPSWAHRFDDSGPLPVAHDRTEGPRGHEEQASPAEEYRPGSGLGTFSEASSTGEFPRATGTSLFGAGQPVHRPRSEMERQAPRSAPDETSEFPRYGGSSLNEPQRTGSGLAPSYGQPHQSHDELPAAPEAGGYRSERTPIFEEMESTWFGARSHAAPSAFSAQESEQPQPPAVPAPRPEQPASAVPPLAQRRPASPEPAGSDVGSGQQWRASPNDERWRQAEQLRQPAAGGVTTSGLPRRVPRANLVAGTAQTTPSAAPSGPQVSRAPDDVRGRLTNLRRGIQQGRRAGSPTDRTDRGPGPTYDQER